MHIWLYTIRYNNLDDWAADNCAMHCQSNIANNVKEYAIMIFNFSVLGWEKHIYCFSQKCLLVENNLSKLSAPPEKKKNHYTFTVSFCSLLI